MGVGKSALIAAAERGDAAAVEAALASGADINARCGTGYEWTSLHYAANGGHARVVALLLTRKADASAPSSSRVRVGYRRRSSSRPIRWRTPGSSATSSRVVAGKSR